MVSSVFDKCLQIYGTPVRALVVVLLFCAPYCVAAMQSDENMYRITFIDKGPDSFIPGTPAYEEALAEFAPRALQRRTLHGKQPLLDTADQPLYAPYLKSLNDLGLHLLAPVRLRNCALALMDTSMADAVKALPFVKRVQRTKERAYEVSASWTDCEPRRHGTSAFTHEQLRTTDLHHAGVLGQGVIVGVIDNGFREQEHTSLAHVDVLGRYDVVEDQPQELNGHGTISLSIIAGNAQDTLIGMAPYASYLLARSEDQRFERRQEEDNFCAALEWVERNGADIVTASVAYRYFDEGEEPADGYNDMDGHTTFPSQSVNRAVALGVTCVTASGNYGSTPRTLITPADADSVITVGGVDSAGAVWSGGSRGPTASGVLKPDVVALAVQTLSLGLGDARYIRADGTSTAAPQVAGGLALLKQLVPEARTYELRQALYASSSHAFAKDSALGYGIPDFTKAARLLGPCFSPPSVVIENNTWLLLSYVFATQGSDVWYSTRYRGVESPLQRADNRTTDLYGFPLNQLTATSDSIEVRLMAHSSVPERTRYYPTDSTWLQLSTQTQIACGAVIPGVIARIADQHVGVRIAHTARTGTTLALPLLLDGAAFLTDAVGKVRSVPHSTTDTQTLVTIPTVARGWYVLSLRNATQEFTQPIIIEE